MMTQEEFMDVMAMKRQGLSIKEIAEETGYHPSTISSWLKNGGPPEQAHRAPPRPVIDECWAARIAELVRAAPRLLATSVFELIAAEGYTGSYVSVARHLNDLRGPRFTAAPAASTRIVTAPGEECQFDWSDVSHWTREWGLGEVQCFSAILSLVPRVRIWWFARSIDREYTFEGLVRFFEFVGGVPKVLRTDRMGALGTSPRAGGSRLHPPAAELRPVPRHRDPGLPGPGRQAQGQGGAPLPGREGAVPRRVRRHRCAEEPGRAQRAGGPLDRGAHPRPGPPGHGGDPRRAVRHRGPDARRRCPADGSTPPMSRPDGCMWPSPRSSGAACTTRCHHAVSARSVEVRHEVDSSTIEIRWAGEVVGTHTVADPDDRRGLGRRPLAGRPAGRPRPQPGPPPVSRRFPTSSRSQVPLRLDIEGDVDVEVPDLARYETGGRVVTNSLYEQLKDDLGYLGLNRSAECFATLAEEAKDQEWSHIEFLARVVGEQASATVNRKLAARLRFARFPFRRTLADFDFEFQPSVDRKLIDDLATLRFIEENRPILFLGQPGCGKTHLAVALATTAVEAGYRGYFTTADDMVNTLVQGQAGRHLGHQAQDPHRPERAGHRRRRAPPHRTGRSRGLLPRGQHPL